VTITSSPPPRHANVTWCSLTKLARYVSSCHCAFAAVSCAGSPEPLFAGNAQRIPRFASMASVSL
jgi:hypothetical protein